MMCAMKTNNALLWQSYVRIECLLLIVFKQDVYGWPRVGSGTRFIGYLSTQNHLNIWGSVAGKLHL